jgi:hypothetical protein
MDRKNNTFGDFRWMQDGLVHADTLATLQSAAEHEGATEEKIGQARVLYAQRVAELEVLGKPKMLSNADLPSPDLTVTAPPPSTHE